MCVWEPDYLELKDEADEARVRDDVHALAEAIVSSSDEDFEARVGEHADLDNFITGYAIDALTHHWDGYSYNTNNYYMYRNPADERFVFMPHGMDQLFQSLDQSVLDEPDGELSRRVRNTPALDQRFRNEVDRVLAEAWDVGELQARLDQVRTVLQATTRTDARVQSDLEGFNQAFEYQRSAVATRKQQFSR